MKISWRNLTAKTFNQRFPIGSSSIITRRQVYGAGTVITRSAAWHMRNGRLVVRSKGNSAAYQSAKWNPLGKSLQQALHKVPAIMATNRRNIMSTPAKRGLMGAIKAGQALRVG